MRAEVFSVEPVGDHAGGGHVAFAGSGEQRAGNAAQGLVRAHQVSKSLAARHQRASNVAKLTSPFNHASATGIATSYFLPSYSRIGKHPLQQPR